MVAMLGPMQVTPMTQMRQHDDADRLGTNLGRLHFPPGSTAWLCMGFFSTSRSRAAWLALAVLPGACAQVRADDAAPRRLEWKFGALVQADHRAVAGDDGEFLWRRIRPSLEGRWGDGVALKIVPELAGGEVKFVDAYLDVALHPRMALRAGRFKTPFGMERLQSGSALAFNERGFTSELGPARDVGVQLHGTLADARVDYAFGVFNGTPDGRDGHSANPDDAHDFAARIVVQPWRGSGGALSDLMLGLAAGHGDRHGAGDAFLPRYRTPGQNTFFRYRNTVMADGGHTRWSPQMAWHGGPFGVMGEVVSSKLRLRDTASLARTALVHRAWQVVGRWVVTGEEASLRGVAKPEGPWGALEAVARMGRLEVDEAAFPRFADVDNAASSARSWGVGLNWYPSQYLKLAANYTDASFDPAPGSTMGRREDERVFFTRVQLAF